jgi:DNA-binding PadR family transcriptional regulator
LRGINWWTQKKKPSDMGPPRKFFKLNDAGREELGRFWERWDFLSSKINELRGGE